MSAGLKYGAKRVAASIVAFSIAAALWSAAPAGDRQEQAANAVYTASSLIQTLVIQVSACALLLDAIQAVDWRAVRLLFNCLRAVELRYSQL